jgi:hypothetical protein
MRIAGLVLFLALSLGLQAQETVTASFARLKTVEIFAFGGVGFVGSTSIGEKDFRILLGQSPDAARASFERLATSGNPPAKAYALTGLRLLKSPSYTRWLVADLKSSETLRTQSGCIVDSESLAKAAFKIDSGKMDWWISHPLRN